MFRSQMIIWFGLLWKSQVTVDHREDIWLAAILIVDQQLLYILYYDYQGVNVYMLWKMLQWLLTTGLKEFMFTNMYNFLQFNYLANF